MKTHPLTPALFLMACALGACTPPAPNPAPAAVDTLAQTPPPIDTVEVVYEGIDVSHYQGVVDWEDVREDGITFAFAKATEGISGVGPQFQNNWPGIKAAGLVRGAYHFFEPEDDPTAQAQHFISTVTLEPGDLPPVLDVETNTGLTDEALNAAVLTWMSTVEAAYGVAPILYSDLSFVQNRLADTLAVYPLWIAEYTDEAPEDLGPWTTWTFWQYSESGTIDGIDGAVDLDRYRGTATAWRGLLVQ